jgi:tetratricopeptide (TPR) repeat protein
MEDKDANRQEIILFVKKVKALIQEGNYDEAYNKIRNGMSLYTNNPEPHNLMGILFEKQGLHSKAMNHFRASYALDATYLPTRHNLDSYGNMFSIGTPAYEESDCMIRQNNRKFKIVYDVTGIGRIVPVKEKPDDEKKRKN